MLQRCAAATYVGRMCPATIGDKIRRKTKHSGTYLHTKGRSWRGGCIYIYISHSNIVVPYHPDTTVVEMDIANNKTYSFKTCNLRDFRTKHGDDTRLSSLWEHEACSAPRCFNIGIAAKTVYANKTANPERDEKKNNSLGWNSPVPSFWVLL